MGGTGWQPLSQPRGASRDMVKSRGKVRASWGWVGRGAGGPHCPVRGQVTKHHHRAASPPAGVSIALPGPSFPGGFLCLDSPGLEGAPPPAPALLARPQPGLHCSPGHHLVVHFHDAVGVTAPRPAEGGG